MCVGLRSLKMSANDTPSHYIRWDNTNLFVRIARSNYECFKQAIAEQERLRQIERSGEFDKPETVAALAGCEETIAQSGCIVIVFAACAIEAHIYDYAARK